MRAESGGGLQKLVQSLQPILLLNFILVLGTVAGCVFLGFLVVLVRMLPSVFLLTDLGTVFTVGTATKLTRSALGKLLYRFGLGAVYACLRW